MKKNIAVFCCTLLTLSLFYVNSPYYIVKNMEKVNVTQSTSQNIFNTINVRGTIEEGEYSWIKSDYNGVISEIYVSEGEAVKAGAVLAKIEISSNDDISISQISSDNINEITENVYNGSISDAEQLSAVLANQIIINNSDTQSNHYYNLISDIDGNVMNLPQIGDSVLKGTSIFKISNLYSLKFNSDVPEMYINQIKEGMSADISWTAEKDIVYNGVIESIKPYAKTSVSFGGIGDVNVEVTAKITGNSQNLRPGYSATAKIFTDYIENAVIIPYESIFQQEQLQFVYVYNNGVLEKRQIETGYEISQGVQVISGVSSGETLVTNPDVDLLYDGLEVMVKH